MKEPLTYSTRTDWGVSAVPLRYVKLYGVIVLLLICAYAWKFHQHNHSVALQAAMGVFAIAAAVTLAASFTAKYTTRNLLLVLISTQCAAQTAALLRFF